MKMIVAVASGKGGTGKTSVAVNLALSVDNVQLLDCDVEEPNAYLFLKPKINKTQVVNVSVPAVNEKMCNRCGKCADFCQFNALFVGTDKVLVFPDLCHSCGGCVLVCPAEAIKEEPYRIGTLKQGSTENMEIVYGELDIQKPMSVPIIAEVKRQIRKDKNVILDSPPGTSCPVIQTIKGSDFCVLVTEPTPFGLHDLKIIVQVLENMNIPFGVVVNRAGAGDKKVHEFCREKNIPVLMEIPYDKRIAELYSQGIPFSREMPEWKTKFQELFKTVGRLAKK
jgi:MinD superfamily P-loop ATPase